MGAKPLCCKVFIKEKEYIDNYILSSPNSITAIIKLQSMYKGYIFRKKRKNLQFEPKFTYINNGMFDDIFNPDNKPGLEVDFTTVPSQEPNPKILKLKEMLPPFEIEQKLENEPLRRYGFMYPDKSLYIGYYNANFERQGFGVYYLPDGSIYEGMFNKNFMHGKGRLLNAEGFCYEGEFIENKANGMGKYISLDGVSYNGNWKNEKQHGYGEEVYQDGSHYKGEFEMGKKHGKGTFTCINGQIYSGDFFCNEICGKGIYKWKDGRAYNGEWVNNKMEGVGIFTWPDNKKYIGSYKTDNKHGYGIFIWPDGKKYEGCWFNGKQHGYGIFTNNGDPQYGEWKSGKKVRWISKETQECEKVAEDLKNIKSEYNFETIEEYVNKGS